VKVEVEERAWERMVVDGAADPTTFKLGGPEVQTVRAVRDQGREWSITSGVDGLTILKTTKSAFTGYIKDKLTTLKPATDRIFGTVPR
jgi:urate oxidase